MRLEARRSGRRDFRMGQVAIPRSEDATGPRPSAQARVGIGEDGSGQLAPASFSAAFAFSAGASK